VIGDFLMWVLEWVIVGILLRGVALVLATPFILISAPFRESGVKGGYASVFRALDKWL
jgi:hypothetical protein